MSNLRIGILGFGRIGNEHSAWISAARGVEVALVADPTPARAELARGQNLAVVDSIDALLADDRIDAVLVATPTSMHADHALAALRAGKHVMIEKPMAMDLPQAKRLVDEARNRSRILSVFHNRRWDLDYLTVAQAIHAGVFGQVFNIESRLGQYASCVGPAAREYRPQWRNEADFGGGGLFDWGSHFIDQLWRLMLPARPTSVFAQLRGNVWAKDCDDFARVLINFNSGAVGLVEINTTTSRPLPRWHIDGSAGSAQSPHSPEFDQTVWSRLTFTPTDGSATRPLPRATGGLSEMRLWEQFARAVAGEAEPAVTAASVLPTMQLLDAARVSSRTSAVVPVEFPTEIEPMPVQESSAPSPAR